jgi:exonuclease III
MMTPQMEEISHTTGHSNIQEIDLQSRVNPNQPVGDSMMLPKRSNIMRMYLQNPNGVSCGKMGDMDMLLDHLKHMEIDIFILPETNLDTHKAQVRSQVHKHFKKALGPGTYQIEMTTSNAEYTGQYKPGGVMGGVIGNTRGRIIESGHDKYGRWIFFRMSGQGRRVITIIGTYQVCQGNVRTAGPTTAITQQYSMLVQDGYNEPHKVREHHAKDLIKSVRERQQQGELIVILGDLNETIGDRNQGLTRLCSECHLVDVVHDKHGYGNRDFNSYARGTTCIDYVLMDERLVGATQGCGYLPFNQLIISDHRGIFVDVDTVWFFGSKTIPMQAMALRDYTTKSIQQTAPFINKQT